MITKNKEKLNVSVLNNKKDLNFSYFLKKKNVFGFWIYLMSDCILFSILFIVFFVMRQHGGYSVFIYKKIFSLSNIFLESFLLLLSSLTCSISVYFMFKNFFRYSVYFLFSTFILGVFFIGLELKELIYFIQLGYGPSFSGFFSAFFVLIITHCLHIFLGLIWILCLLYFSFKKKSLLKFQNIFICFSLFWHFLDIIWTILVPCVYF